MRALCLACLLIFGFSPVFAEPLPPRREANQSKSAWSSPFASILQWTTKDLNSAIAAANAATPPDTDAVNCYSALLNTVNVVQANGGLINWPPTLVTDYELAWLIHAQVQSLKVNSSCAVVCGRAATMMAIYGATINQFCTTLSKLP